MLITFGKHTGRSSEEVTLKHASYAKWVLEQVNAGSGLMALRKDIDKLIKKFDANPFSKSCHGCSSPATNVTAYWNNDAVLYRWCDSCDPYSAGANAGKLYVLRSVSDAFRHVQLRCGGTNGGYDRIIKALAQSKGLPNRVSASAAKNFFS